MKEKARKEGFLTLPHSSRTGALNGHSGRPREVMIIRGKGMIIRRGDCKETVKVVVRVAISNNGRKLEEG